MYDYDINTPEGMAAAKLWTLALLQLLSEGGMWMVPRSGSIYKISTKTKTLIKLTGLPEPSITRVCHEIGWIVIDEFED